MAGKNQIPENKVQHLQQRLAEELPLGARFALCLDPENHLEKNNVIVDAKGRIFTLLTYCENDLPFRLALRTKLENASANEPLLLRVTLPLFALHTHQINLSSIADVVAGIESPPIDLRTDAVVAHYTEPVVWPEKLQSHAFRIGQQLPEFVQGYWRMREAIGKRQTLAAYHISAALLLGRYRALRYQDLNLAVAWPPEIIARGIGFAARYQMNEEDRQLLLEVMLGTARQTEERSIQDWLTMSTAEAACLLVVTDFLAQQQIPNAVMLLSGLGLFSQPVSHLRETASEVTLRLQEQPEDWLAVSQLTDTTLTENQATEVVALLRDVHPAETWLHLITDATPRSLALALLTGWLKAQLATNPPQDWLLPEVVPLWAEPQLDSWETPHYDSSYEERATALFRLLHYVGRIQTRLRTPLPPSDATLDDCLAFYAETDEHRLELLLALAGKETDALTAEPLVQAVDAFLSALGKQVALRLDRLDETVAAIIDRKPEAYRRHTRNSSRFLRTATQRRATAKSRLFVWLFDGMRWDTWVDVVRPLLEEGFRIEDQKPLLAPLPTYTGFARTAVFAGSYPDAWRGWRGGFTRNEGELAARNLGVRDQQQYEQEVVFVTQTDTANGKAKLRQIQPRRYNLLVFNISDDNIHDEQGDLREVNNAIRLKVKTDVLPEMKRMVEPGDMVLITSDHGFVQLRRDREIPVQVLRLDQPEVRRRYAFNREELDGVVLPDSDKRDVQSTTCAIGRAWFSRDTSKGKNYTRYDHGGLSLSEMVVPGVILHKATVAEDVQLEVITPERLVAVEDERLRLEVKVLNQGTSLLSVRVTMAGGATKVLELAKGEAKTWATEIQATLSMNFAEVRVEYRKPNGRYAPVPGGTRQIPLTVQPRTDKVVFSDALDVFDDI